MSQAESWEGLIIDLVLNSITSASEENRSLALAFLL
jgi:hypothetical protein